MPDETVGTIRCPTAPEYNAFLWLEYDIIALAAGWREGMTAQDRGTPRPPVCHHP